MLEKQLFRKILGLGVYCHHKSKGCDWKGELRSLDRHMEGGSDTDSGCEFVEVICQYDCGERLMRCEVKGHELRDCPKRPVETQVNQLREVIEEMKGNHAKEITELEGKLEAQTEIIGELKLRMDQLEERNDMLEEKITGMSSPGITSAPPPAPPPPPLQNSNIPFQAPIIVPPPPPLQLRDPHRSIPVRMPGMVPPPPPLPMPLSLPQTRNDNVIELNTGCKVSLVFGDIVWQKVDVIVSSTSTNMKLNSGVSRSLNKVSNNRLQRECDRRILHSGDLSLGDVVSVPASGRLKCSNIVFVAPPMYFNAVPSIELYKKSLAKCLEKAESLNAKSVAFSAVGMATQIKKPEVIAAAILEALINYSYSKLVDVRIVVIHQSTHDTFAELFRREKTSGTSGSSLPNRIISYIRGHQ